MTRAEMWRWRVARRLSYWAASLGVTFDVIDTRDNTRTDVGQPYSYALGTVTYYNQTEGRDRWRLCRHQVFDWQSQRYVSPRKARRLARARSG